MRPAAPPDRVFRLGRRPDPWAWPDWAHAAPDGTFGNRYDDPLGIYRVLYASSQRLATFVECLAYFRPDPAVVAALAEIDGAEDADEPPPAGIVPREWVAARCLGTAVLAGEYVDIGHHATIAELRMALAARVVHHRVGDLDAGTIRLSAPRAFAQEVSRYVYERSTGGARTWDGISYRSKHGDDLENWAIFEPCTPQVVDVAGVDAADADLAAALALQGLALG